MAGQNYVIIGGGQAGLSGAAKLRQLDDTANITLICGETHLPYQRPPLSKKYALGEMDAEQLLLRPADWFEENRIDCKLGTFAASIDAGAKTVMLNSGDEVAYDKLLIATGSSPRCLPSGIGGDLDGVYTVRDIADIDTVKPQLLPGKNAVVVGGGYIGLEAAAVLRKIGLNVTVVEMAERILQRVAGPDTSDFLREKHREEGVEILEGIGVARLIGSENQVTGVELSDGRTVVADMVIAGIGILPDVELATSAELDVENGIVVNQFSQSTDASIYAAGDCANFEFRGQRIRLESVQNAIDQAENAAKNMAGGEVPYKPYPWFWSDQYDLKLQIAGLNTGFTQTVVRPGERPGTQSVWYFKDEQFISVDSMNDPRAYMVGKKLLEMGKNVSPEQIADTGVELKSLMK